MRNSSILFAGLLAICLPASVSAAIYTVTSPAATSSTGTLYWATQQASINPGLDTIRFSIGSGPVDVYLPGRTFLGQPIIIDGSSQPGFSGTPLISIKLAGIDKSGTFVLSGDNIQLRSLALTENITDVHVKIWGSNCVVENCWIGVNSTFTPTSGATGIFIGYPGGPKTGNLIKKCLIGYQKTGILVIDSINTKIEDCAIGTGFSGVRVLPCVGSGIELYGTTRTYIGPGLGGTGNVIANCGDDGVALLESEDTVIINNRIFNIGELAIDHGMDNSTNYFESGQRAPEQITVTRTNGSIHITGELNSYGDPLTEFLIEVVAGPKKSPTGSGHAQYLVGLLTVTTNNFSAASIDKSFPDTLPDQYEMYFSASATKLDQSYGTSSFSMGSLPVLADTYQESDLGSNPAWVPSGVDSGPEYGIDPSSPDDIDIEAVPNELRVTVRPSPGRNRIAGWSNSNLMTLPSIVDNILFVRGKFYIHTSNLASAPLNTVPNFRLRLDNEGSVISSTAYQFATTGRTGVPHEQYYGTTNNASLEARVGPSMRPSSNAALPSLYRIDLCPVIVDAAFGSRIGASFEAFSTEDPANGTLALTEVQLATYTQVSVSATNPYAYASDADFFTYTSNHGLTIDTLAVPGAFNIEADFQAGRRQALDLGGEVSASLLPQVFETMDDNGTILDTLNTPADKAGVGLFSFGADSFTSAPRVEPGKSYLAIFIASSDMPAVASTPGQPVQGGMSFQMQTGGGVITSRLELAGPANLAAAEGSAARRILEEALPGKDSKNLFLVDYPFPPGENGGAYVMMLPSPLDPDIRRDTPGDTGPFFDEPGPGVDLQSYRDITFGVNAISQPASLRLSPTLVIPWAPPNRARVRLQALLLGEIPTIDDGGYLP